MSRRKKYSKEFKLDAVTYGNSMSGSFEYYFDGSDVGFNKPNEDIQGVWIDPVSDAVHVTVRRKFNVGVVKDDGRDIVICEPLDCNPVSGCNPP